MDAEQVRQFCLSLPDATERVQWVKDLLFCVGDKMFAVMCLDAAAEHKLSFKCTPEQFEALIELDGVVPAPYLARYKWVALQRWDALEWNEMQRLLRRSYALVREKLPLKVRERLGPFDVD
jgi:predicted DNA-binding protein (MmcQ/YjbR family)